jgi:hypothetical protein
MKETVKLFKIRAALLMTVMMFVSPGLADGSTGESWVFMTGRPSSYFSAPTYADIDNDGDMEIFTVQRENSVEQIICDIYAFHHDGEPVIPGNPVFLDVLALDGVSTPSITPSIVDLDQDGFAEIIFGTDPTSNSRIYIYSHDGYPINNWSVTDAVGPNWKVMINTPVVVSDLEGDGSSEIIVPLRVIAGAHDRIPAAVFSSSGELREGWPPQFTDLPFTRGSPIITVSDITGDGIKEVIVRTKGSSNAFIWVLNTEGEELWRYEMSAYDVVTADVNRDGVNEVLALDYPDHHQNGSGGESWFAKLVVFKGNGSVVFEDEIILGDYIFNYYWDPDLGRYVTEESNVQLNFDAVPHLMLGDLNGNSVPEVVFALVYRLTRHDDFWFWYEHIEYYSEIHAFEPGKCELQGFPISVDHLEDQNLEIIWAEALADVDGDRQVDILAQQRILDPLPLNKHKIYAFNRYGNLISGWPKYLEVTTPPHPVTGQYKHNQFIRMAVGDFNNDGDIDLIRSSVGGELHLLDLEKDFNPEVMEWPLYRFNAQHSGCYSPHPQSLPDLIIKRFSARLTLEIDSPNSVQENSYQKIKLTATIKNNGFKNITTPFEVTFYIAFQSTPSIKTPIGTVIVPSLGINETATATKYWNGKPGLQVFFVFADSAEVIEESDESNNWASTTLFQQDLEDH